MTENSTFDRNNKSARAEDQFRPVPKHLQAKKGQKNKFKQDNITIVTQDNIPLDVDPDTNNVATNMDTSPPVPKKTRKPPPIFIIPPDLWYHSLFELRNIAPSLLSALKGKFLRLTVCCVEEYKAVLRYLDANKIQHKTYLLEEDKPFKVVLRGFPYNTSLPFVTKCFEELGYEDVKITPFVLGTKKNPKLTPMYIVLVKRTSTVMNIFDITYLHGTEVRIEKFKGSSGPTQCFNCQGFFHSSIACNLAPRCVVCGEGHRTGSDQCCVTEDKDRKCANCGGNHAANYRKCPKWPILKKPRGKKPAKISKPQQTVRFTPQQSTARPCGENPPINVSRPSEQSNYAKALSGSNSTPPKAPAKSSVPSFGDHSDTDFLNNLLAFEANYDKKLILAAFKDILPTLRVTPNPIDKIFILYERIVTLSE